jgi:hypothetical protein
MTRRKVIRANAKVGTTHAGAKQEIDRVRELCKVLEVIVHGTRIMHYALVRAAPSATGMPSLDLHWR